MATIALVDDDENIVEALTAFFEAEGYQVRAYHDGAAALAGLSETPPDIAILDVKMPKMDGITAASTIAEERIAPVVMLTAFSQRELIEEAGDAGVHGYVVKPFERHDLVPAIEVAISRFRAESLLVEQVASAEDRLDARKVIDRAKGVLMDAHSLSESDAYAFIQKAAMKDRRQMRDVAQEVLDGALAPTPPTPPTSG